MLDQQPSADMDGSTYLKTIIAVAHSDGDVPEKEKDFIEMQAQLLSLDSSEFWKHPELDLSFLNNTKMSRPTCMTIIRDCIVLGNIDGDLNDTERAKIHHVASLLGLEPIDVQAVESWLKELWAVMEKGTKLFGV